MCVARHKAESLLTRPRIIPFGPDLQSPHFAKFVEVDASFGAKDVPNVE